jgi:hypothetical protein
MEEKLEDSQSAWAQRINDATKGDVHKKSLSPNSAVSSKATEVALQPASLKQLASFISAQLQQARLDYFLYFLCHALRQ